MQNDNTNPAESNQIEQLKENFRQKSAEELKTIKLQIEYCIGKTTTKAQRKMMQATDLNMMAREYQLQLQALEEVLEGK